MQIGTSYSNYYVNTQNINNKNNQVKKEENSFSSHLEKSSIKEVYTQHNSSEILNYLNKYNAFEGYSKEDEKIYREILSDGKLSESDMEKLSFKQIQQLQDLVLKVRDVGIPQDGSLPDTKLPILNLFEGKSWDFISASNYTNNDNFNKALLATVKELENTEDIRELFLQVSFNLAQELNNSELKHEVLGGDYDSKLISPETKKDYDNINYGKFLDKYVSYLTGKINYFKQQKPNESILDIIRRLTSSADLYLLLQKNFHEVESRNGNK